MKLLRRAQHHGEFLRITPKTPHWCYFYFWLVWRFWHISHYQWLSLPILGSASRTTLSLACRTGSNSCPAVPGRPRPGWCACPAGWCPDWPCCGRTSAPAPTSPWTDPALWSRSALSGTRWSAVGCPERVRLSLRSRRILYRRLQKSAWKGSSPQPPAGFICAFLVDGAPGKNAALEIFWRSRYIWHSLTQSLQWWTVRKPIHKYFSIYLYCY